MAIRYTLPEHWIIYNQSAIFSELVEAKAATKALQATHYQRDWVDALQALQFKMEVAGTSRIEGADFTESELADALAGNALTRSQRQAKAAADTYRWIADIPPDRPIDETLVCEIHRRMVTGCDDDHCEPGTLRRRDSNVTFGLPLHRGCEGGAACREAFSKLIGAIGRVFPDHDPLIQAMATHYHFAAMHPFKDGNGRTARALEALLLQRAGLRDTAFIAMSNYYHDEKPRYLSVLTEVRRANHDLTAFLKFSLRGVALQCDRLLRDIRTAIKKAVFKETMNDLFHRLKTPKKRLIAERQLAILEALLENQRLESTDLLFRTLNHYRSLRDPGRAIIRDLNALIHLGAIRTVGIEGERQSEIRINLDWPAEIRESDFFEKVKAMPRAKTPRTRAV